MIKIELIDHSGGDISVVNSARVSFDKESKYYSLRLDTEEEVDAWFAVGGKGVLDEDFINSDNWNGSYFVNMLNKDDLGLVKYLASHRHTTPFRHNFISLRCKAPIFLARQLGKHQVGLSWNEVSRRYVDTEPEFYIPHKFRGRPEGSIKQGSYGEVPDFHRDKYIAAVQAMSDEYELMIAGGVAPEMARMILPQSMLTSWYWSGNLLAFAHVYKERISSGSQEEARVFARQLDRIIRPLFPCAWSALVGELDEPK